ncbi:MAG: anaerobic ribonucleoside-triphosphate reductase activating protein, partial [Candidatus Bathyarchaeota archaeon]|nr:anaerobic ribonucleoside-triphosphate reductase activating protein [Candidatus Bathyarchaeota archaeon]
MRIGGFVDMSTLDWYGNVSLVVFFAGCNFRCPYCQNSGLLPVESGEEVDLDTIHRRILVNMSPVPQLDAVVFSGGEPLLQPEGLMEAARLVKGLGLKLMLDTNGSIPGAVEPLLAAGLVDRVALDIKAPLTLEDYRRVARLGEGAARLMEGVKRTLALCNDYGVEIEARTTVAPTVSDGAEFIGRIARDIRDRCNVYYLQQFDNTGDVL